LPATLYWFPRGIEHRRKSVGEGPDRAADLISRAVKLEKRGRSEKAIETYDEVVERFGESADPAVLR